MDENVKLSGHYFYTGVMKTSVKIAIGHGDLDAAP